MSYLQHENVKVKLCNTVKQQTQNFRKPILAHPGLPTPVEKGSGRSLNVLSPVHMHEKDWGGNKPSTKNSLCHAPRKCDCWFLRLLYLYIQRASDRLNSPTPPQRGQQTPCEKSGFMIILIICTNSMKLGFENAM